MIWSRNKITLIAVVFAVLIGIAAADDVAHPTGYRPPPKGGVQARRVVGAKSPVRLRTSRGTPLPSRWDARDQGWVSPVKSQGNVGACWAFAACATLETQLLRTGRGLHDFSEKNMVNLNGWEGGPDNGGNNDMAAGYLLRWEGVVAETNDVYAKALSWWTPSPRLAPVARVCQIVLTPPLDGTQTSIDAVKAAVMEYGAISVAIGWYGEYGNDGNGTYYCPANKRLNHAITLVGWDDAYPTNNFRTKPPGNGAWIIKNSWGRLKGDGGFYYVSFHDATFGRGETGAVFIPAGEGEDYDVVRGHDRLGVVYDVSQTYRTDPLCQYDYQAAVFTAAWGEQLAAVGVWSSLEPTPYEISIYTNVTRGAASPVADGVLARQLTGTLSHAGFTAIPLEAPLTLANGATFSIVYRQTGTERSTCVNCTSIDTCNPVHSRGNSFFGWDDGNGGVDWVDGVDEAVNVDVTDISWGACIKAYTRCLIVARSDDAPRECDDGTDFLDDLARTNAVLFAETSGTVGAVSGLIGLNGRTLWTSWLAGFDPSNPNDGEFLASISIANGEPRLSWTPDLGDRRTYIVEGRESLTEGSWGPTNAASRFFRVKVALP
jgi:C1A family cysteine protease